MYVNKYWLFNVMTKSDPIDFNNFSKNDLIEMLNILHIFMYSRCSECRKIGVYEKV